MAKKQPSLSELEFGLNERLFILRAVKTLPGWVFGFVFWLLFSRFVLAKLFPKKLLGFDVGTVINLAILGLGGEANKVAIGGASFFADISVDVLGNLPPGVTLAALVDVTVDGFGGAVSLWEDLEKRLGEAAHDIQKADPVGAAQKSFYSGVMKVMVGIAKVIS